MKKGTGKRIISCLVISLLMFGVFQTQMETVLAKEVSTETQTEEITEEQLQVNEYETFYYAEGTTYTYQGQSVTFISGNQFKAGGTVYDLKNAKTQVEVTENESGNVQVSLSNLSTPVGQIDGQWNSTWGGTVQMLYQTDIPGLKEVCSADSAQLQPVIDLGNLEEGVYHLTGGTIYEKANSYSPGADFGSGVVTEGYFGTLPNITVTVQGDQETGGTEEDRNTGGTEGDANTGGDTDESLPSKGEGDTGNGEANEDDQITEINSYLGVKTEAKIYDDFQNDIWLQYQQKELKVGDSAPLWPWRVEQIISSSIDNDVQRPDFHFEIIAGDSVELSSDTSEDLILVIAVKPGTTVVKVTYDPLDYKGKHWGATSPVNTAYAVFTVGETGTAKIQADEKLQNWRHYDTIYYSEGSTVPYTFAVNTKNASKVRVTCNGLEVAGKGNSYTVNLENRSNIIGIEATDDDGNVRSMYRVIDARYIKVNVANKTNPGEKLEAGDTATVSFRGITMPVYKLASIYNPQFGGGTKVVYSNEKQGRFEGKCSQWDLATKNSFDVTFEKGGDYTFTSEGINCKWWGSPLGTDMEEMGVGGPNLNASEFGDNFSELPDFQIHVEGEDQDGGTDDEETADEKAARKVIEKIAGLGEITSLMQEKKVVDAREAYDKLTDDQKKLVTNLADLKAAEKKIAEIKQQFQPGTSEPSEKPGALAKPGNGGSKKPSGTIGTVNRKTTVRQQGKSSAKKESNTIDAKIKNGIVSADQVEKVAGKGMNLRMRSEMEDGTKYTLTIYGEDIKEIGEINTGVIKKSVYEKEMNLLASDPEIFVFAQKGKFPGKILAELSTEKEDGTYLLFRYNEEEQRAEYVQKVTVKDGKVKLILTEGGHYFIAERAKTKPVSELNAENTEEQVMTGGNVNGDSARTNIYIIVLAALGGAFVATAFFVGFLVGNKKRGTKHE